MSVSAHGFHVQSQSTREGACYRSFGVTPEEKTQAPAASDHPQAFSLGTEGGQVKASAETLAAPSGCAPKSNRVGGMAVAVSTARALPRLRQHFDGPGHKPISDTHGVAAAFAPRRFTHQRSLFPAWERPRGTAGCPMAAVGKSVASRLIWVWTR